MPIFLTPDLALRLHHRAIECHGGMPGVRDLGALESALAQAEATFDGIPLHETVFEQAAAYLPRTMRSSTETGG